MLRAVLVRIVYMIILFLANLILSNLALPEKFGILSMLILNASLLMIATGFGVDSMILYKLSNKQWNVSQAFHFMWRGIFLQIIIFAVLEAGAWLLFHKTLLCNGTPDYFIVEVCYFVGLSIIEKYISLFYAQNQSAAANRILAIVAFFYLLILVLCYHVIKVQWSFILYLFAFQNIAQALALMMNFKIHSDTKTNLRNREVFSALKISSLVMITNVIQLMAYRVDFWLLDFFYGNYEVGLYAQANKFANFSWMIPNIVSQILIPEFASMNKNRTSEIFSVGFCFNFLTIILTIFFADFFYFFYLQPEYQKGLTAFYLMLPGYFFWGSVIYFANYFSAKGKFVYNFIGSLLCFILIFAADVILIPKYGIRGAGLANTIAYSLVFMIYLFVFMKKNSFRLNDLLLPRRKAFSNIFKIVSE